MRIKITIPWEEEITPIPIPGTSSIVSSYACNAVIGGRAFRLEYEGPYGWSIRVTGERPSYKNGFVSEYAAKVYAETLL